jgi:hypothetical protein
MGGGGETVKLRFGYGDKRVFEVSVEKDYLFENNGLLCLATNDPARKQINGWKTVNSWRFSKARLQKLLKGGFVILDDTPREKCGHMTFYRFTEKANEFSGELR